MADNMEKVEHVVVDAPGFIRNAALQDIGSSIYTVQDVVKEIKDKATKQRLQVLPYKLQFKEPSAVCIKSVSDFSKKTGDYRSLSAVDIKVIALTLMLEQEKVGTDHIRTEPVRKEVWTAGKSALVKTTDIAGFYLKKKLKDKENESRTTSESECIISEPADDVEPEVQIENDDTEDDVMICDRIVSNEELLEEDEDESDDDDDNEGWITPSNIKSVRAAMGDRNTEKAAVPVGCLTTDFAVQNVLIQMGLNVISVDGMLIKHTKNFILRCTACMKLTTNLEKEFCPNCGNKTLKKVSMSVEEDGSIKYYLSCRKPITTKGLKYSLPLPKGGKHSSNPILCEDQREAQKNITKAAKNNARFDIFSPDFIANSSPFALNDVTSRSAQLGFRAGQRKQPKNPNESHKRRGRRK